MANPVADRTSLGSARPHDTKPRAPANFTESTRCAPLVNANTKPSSPAEKIMDFTIWAT